VVRAASESRGPSQVDYRFLLANERTFLAYLRTALSLQVAGLGVLQFLTGAEPIVRYALGLVMVALGSVVGVTGHRRRRSNEQAMRAGEELAPLPLSMVVALAATVPLVAAVVLVVVDAH
jgi:putative membrane protein